MKMCGSSPASSKVQQCKNSPSIPSFPMTSEVIKNVYGICTSMPTMRACDSCKLSGDSVNTGNVNGCDVMKTYSSLCIDMPDMSQCTSYKSMCSQNPTMSWCETPPQASGMAMYFHTSMGNYILFQSWFPSTTGQYALAWLATFCLALVYEIIVVAIEVWEIHLRYKYNARKAQQQNSSMQKSRPILSHFGGYTNESLGQGAAGLRGMFRFVQASVGYLCMLIVMTYNVGLFFAIMMGFAIGTWLFRPIGIGYAEKLKVFTLQPEDACMC
jgi:copper transporter 1